MGVALAEKSGIGVREPNTGRSRLVVLVGVGTNVAVGSGVGLETATEVGSGTLVGIGAIVGVGGSTDCSVGMFVGVGADAAGTASQASRTKVSRNRSASLKGSPLPGIGQGYLPQSPYHTEPKGDTMSLVQFCMGLRPINMCETTVEGSNIRLPETFPSDKQGGIKTSTIRLSPTRARRIVGPNRTY